MPLELSRRLFTVEEFHRLAEAGVLGKDDRVELIEGEILIMSPIGPAHAFAVSRVTEILIEKVGKNGRVWTQNPIILGPRSEPQPDVLVLKRRDEHYRTHLPERSDVLLAVEVADSSLTYDRQVKLQLYAVAGMAESWILSVGDKLIERYTGPRPDGYTHMDRLRSGDSVTLVALPHVTISLAALLD